MIPQALLDIPKLKQTFNLKTINTINVINVITTLAGGNF